MNPSVNWRPVLWGRTTIWHLRQWAGETLNLLRVEPNINERESALDTLMKRWMDAVETKDESVKDHFREGMNKLVQNSAEDNGVWQMMVAASALHERQIHDLDKLREENDEMRKSIEGRFATPDSRKRPADHQLDRSDVVEAAGSNMWEDFAADVSKFCS